MRSSVQKGLFLLIFLTGCSSSLNYTTVPTELCNARRGARSQATYETDGMELAENNAQENSAQAGRRSSGRSLAVLRKTPRSVHLGDDGIRELGGVELRAAQQVLQQGFDAVEIALLGVEELDVHLHLAREDTETLSAT